MEIYTVNKYNLKLNFIENKETDSIYNLKGYGNLIIKTFTKKLICDNHIVVDAPAYFKRIGEKKFYVRYEEVIPRKYWDGPIGLKLYMEMDI